MKTVGWPGPRGKMPWYQKANFYTVGLQPSRMVKGFRSGENPILVSHTFFNDPQREQNNKSTRFFKVCV
jgi:hypothetical protein